MTTESEPAILARPVPSPRATAKRARSKPGARRIPNASKPAAAPKIERKRRSPEEARRTILAAAQKLLAEHGPDAIGLKEIAREANVSHGLVSHYFGTYESLVDAALADHLTSQRLVGIERIMSSPPNPEAWLDIAFEQLAHPLSGRLLVWAMLTGRLEREDFVVFRDRGLAQVVDLLEAYMRAAGKSPDREELERGVLIGFCAVIGYSLGRSALWGALGRRASAEKDLAFRSQLATMLLAALPA
jgi:TetR/AcrR family transcriptional regulator, repressor for neighboring sulfatase